MHAGQKVKACKSVEMTQTIKMPQANTIITQKLPVMEHFYTLQGEGYHQGRAAYFIRLGGCDVGCVWCDVKESWDANAHPKRSVTDIVSDVLQNCPHPSGDNGK